MWTLAVGDLSRTLAEWRISGLTRQRSSQAADTLSFTIAAEYDAELEIAEGDVVTVYRDGVQWFVGRVITARRVGSGKAHGVQYAVAGPWWYLERLVYQQVWTYGTTEIRKSHCILNQFADGTSAHTDDQIDEALEWAADRAEETYGSRPFQWDAATFPDLQIPMDEVRDITVAEVIRKQLRWIPDAVTWWDYTTTPPTFRVARRADLTSREIAVSDRLTALDITAREDLVVPAVVLKYERVDTVDGISAASVSTDVAPTGATGEEFGAFVATIDLQGLSVNFARAAIVADALPTTQAGWTTWLKRKAPWLTDSRITVTLQSITRSDPDHPSAETLPRELVSGQVADWMGFDVQSETVVATVRLGVTLSDGTQAADEVRKITVNIKTTDGTTGTYSTVASSSDGETPPIGLASALYTALSALEYEGTLTRVTQDLPADADAITVGCRLSLTGARSEWAAMAAPVQEVTDNVDTGTQSIRFGPPQHLGPRDLVELLRVNRFRFIYTAPAARTGGSTAAGVVQLGSHTTVENTSDGRLARQKLVVAASTGVGGRFTLDIADTDGKELKAREISVCVNGVEKRMLILCSEPFDP